MEVRFDVLKRFWDGGRIRLGWAVLVMKRKKFRALLASF